MMDVRIVRPDQLSGLQRWLIVTALRDEPCVAFVNPSEDPELVQVMRLNDITAHRVIAHEGLHIILWRLFEWEASVMLDRIWARRRIGRAYGL